MSEKIVIDWGQVPVPCKACGRLLRPQGTPTKGRWADTTIHTSKGLCSGCRNRIRRANKAATKHKERHVHQALVTQPQTRVMGDSYAARRWSLSHTTAGGGQVTWEWAMLPGDVPLIHQEHEAYADLMDMLRERGLMLTSRPRVTVHHGRRPVLRMAFTVAPSTVKEAAA